MTIWRRSRACSLTLCQLFLMFCHFNAFNTNQNWVPKRRVRFVQTAESSTNNPRESVQVLPSSMIACASSLHETLLALRTELPRTAFEVGSPELYADDVVLVAETGEVLLEGAEEYAQLSMRVTSAVAAAQALAGVANRALASAGASDTTVRDAKLIRCDMFLDDIGLEDALVQPFTTMQSSSSARMATTPSPPVQVVVRWAIDLPGLVSSSDVNILNIPGTNRDVGAALRLEGTSVLDLVPTMLSAKPPSNEAEAAAAVQWRVKVHKLANVSANGAPLTALGTALGNLRSVGLGGRVNDPTSSTSPSSPLGQSLWSQLQASAERALDTSLALAAAQAQTEASKSGQQLPEPAPLTRLSEDEEATTSATTQSQVAEAKSPLTGGALPKTWPWVLPGTGAWELFAAAEAALSDWLAYLPWQFQQSPPLCALAPDVGLFGLAGEVVLIGSEAYESAMLGLGGLRRTGKQPPFLALVDAEDKDVGDSRGEASSPPPCVELLAVTVTPEKPSSSEKQFLQSQDESRDFAASADPAAELARETATTAWARSTNSSSSSSGGHASPGPGAWFEVEVKWRYRADLRVSSSGGGLLGAAMPPAPLNFEGRCVYCFDRTLRSGENSPETGKSCAVEPIDYLLSKHRVMAAAVNGIEVESSAVTQWVSRLSSGSGVSSSSDRSSTGVGSAQALAELASWLQRQSIVNFASSSRSSTRADTTTTTSSSSRKGEASTSEDSAKDSKGGNGGAFSAPAWRAQLPSSGRLMPKFSASSSPLLRSPPPRRHWNPPAADAPLSANATATASVGSAAAAADAAAAARRAELVSVGAFLDALHFSTPRSLATPLLPTGWLRPDVQLKGQLDEPWAVGKPSVEALCSAFVTVTARLLADGTLVPAVSPQLDGEASGSSARSTSSSNRPGSAAQAAARAEDASIAAMTHAVEYTPEGHVLLRWRADLEARPPLGLAGPSLPLKVEGTSLLILDASAIAATPDASPAAIIDSGAPVPLVAEHRVLEVAINKQPSLSQVADWAQQWSQGARPSSTALAAAPFKLFEWLARYSR